MSKNVPFNNQLAKLYLYHQLMKSYVCACWFALPDRLFFAESWLLACLLTGLLAGLLAGLLVGLLAGLLTGLLAGLLVDGLPLAVFLFLFRCLLYLSFGGFITRPFIWLFVAGVVSFLVACCLFLGCVFFSWLSVVCCWVRFYLVAICWNWFTFFGLRAGSYKLRRSFFIKN